MATTTGANDDRKEVAGEREPGDDHGEDAGNDKTCGCIARTWKCTLCRFPCCDRTVDLYISPITMFLSIAFIWGFVIWAALDADAPTAISGWQTWIVENFTWLYVGALVMFGGFTTFILFSRFGDIKLGPKDEPPTFSLISWFAMLFSAGVGVGLYFFGVAEPVDHYINARDGSNRYWDESPLEQAMDALNISWFHWGLTASCIYCVVGLPLAYVTHVKNEPLKLSSVFIPLVGRKYINGFIGDIIDTASVVGTMFGVATSLGLGVIQINSGLNFLFGVTEGDITVQIITIWIITCFATLSVFSGLEVGIRRLSEGNFVFCLLLLFYLFFRGNPVYQLNLFVQGIGYHINHLFEVTFFTDAFEQAGCADVEDNVRDHWMAWWTIFYWAWWIAWSPFVGIFIAQISRGRTIREFILGNVLVPTIFTSVWYTVFGGLGLWHEVMGDQVLGLSCDDIYGEYNGQTVVLLECFGYSLRLFELINAYPLGDLMSVFAMIGIVTYFVTSSDSASHVIDVLTANGNEDPPKLQRLFWAFSEGAVASVLLAVGGSSALSALQTVSIASALPFTLILIALCYAFWYSLRVDMGEIDPDNIGQWKYDLWDSLNCASTSGANIVSWVISLIVPCFTQSRTHKRMTQVYQEHEALAEADKKSPRGHQSLESKSELRTSSLLKDNDKLSPDDDEMPPKHELEADKIEFKNGAIHMILWLAAFCVPYTVFIVCDILQFAFDGWAYVGICFYVFFAGIGAYNRSRIREYFNIDGNICCDCLAHSFCFPFALVQESRQAQDGEIFIPDPNRFATKKKMLASSSSLSSPSGPSNLKVINDYEDSADVSKSLPMSSGTPQNQNKTNDSTVELLASSPAQTNDKTQDFHE